MRWKPTSGSLCSCNRCISNNSEQVYYFWAVHTEPTQCPYQMGRPLTHELPAEIPMVFLHDLFVILLSTHPFLSHLPSRHMLPLPSSSCWWWPFGCTHTRCIFLFRCVPVLSNSIRPSGSNSDPQEPVLPTPGPRACFFGDWPEVRV